MIWVCIMVFGCMQGLLRIIGFGGAVVDALVPSVSPKLNPPNFEKGTPLFYLKALIPEH